MARVISIEIGENRGNLQPSTVDARVKVFGEGPDGPIVQIDTFGSEGREVQGAASQTMQFNRQTGTMLLEILERAYR